MKKKKEKKKKSQGFMVSTGKGDSATVPLQCDMEEEVGGGNVLHLLSDHRRDFAECMTSASSPQPSLFPDMD